MRLFCLLCIPLFYFLRKSAFPGNEGNIRAVLLGGAAVVVQYFFSPFITPGGFGVSRWLSGFIDIVSLPVLIPFAACLLLTVFKLFSAKVNYANFTLLWLIPLAAYSAVTARLPPAPIPLILVPVLWAAQTEGMAFFIQCIEKRPRWYVIIPSAMGIAALPLAATTSWWAFFCLQAPTGFLFLALSVIPASFSIALSYRGKFSMGKGSTPSIVDLPESDMINLSSPSATPEHWRN